MKVNSENNLAVKGYDVVALFSEKVRKGKSSIAHEHNGISYQFESTDNRDKFINSPSEYLPQYGGFCAIAMSEGKEVDSNPKSFKIQNGKLYLFATMFWGIIDVKRQWNKDPNGKMKLADKEWDRINR